MSSENDQVLNLKKAISLEFPYDRRILELSRDGEPRLPSSILVLLSQDHLLMIKRAADAQHHPAQIAFPGGRLESEDGPFESNQVTTLVKAALRETYEEVGLDCSRTNILGVLPRFPTVSSSYWIYPVIAYDLGEGGFCRDVPLRCDVREIEKAFWIPLAALKSGESLRMEWLTYMGEKFQAPNYFFQGEKIWGASAMILKHLFDRMAIIERGSFGI